MANLTCAADDTSHNMTAAILDFTPQETPQAMTEDESSIMSSSSSESETPSLSLPSVPLSIQTALPHAQSVNSLARCTSVSSMTMKEFDNKLNELRKENFNLKLRLYFMEKQRNGITKPECETFIQQELTRKESIITQLQEDLTLRESEIKSMKNTNEKVIKKLNAEWKGKLDQVEVERDEAVANLSTTKLQLDTTSNVAKSLMDHLVEIRDFWKQNLQDLNTSKDVIKSLNMWFNSSEDVLNSASVLITEDQENRSYLINRSSHLAIGDHGQNLKGHLQTSAQACLPSTTLLPSNAADNYQAVQEMYQHYRDQLILHQQELQQPSSESDDWSEPNREVSRARIGLDVIDDPDSCLVYPPPSSRYSIPPSLCPVARAPSCFNTALHKKPKSKRKTSGMSSLGVLSDLSGLIDEGDTVEKLRQHHHYKRPHTSEPLKVDASLQTNLTFVKINEIFKTYDLMANLLNKELIDVGVQSDLAPISTSDGCSQTDVRKFAEKSIPTQCDLKPSSAAKSTSSWDLVHCKSFGVQSEGCQKLSKSVQIQVTESQLQKRAHFGSNKFLSPCREMLERTTIEGDVTTFKEISTSGHERTRTAINNGLYSYKLTAERQITPKSKIPTSVTNPQALNCSSYQLTPTSSAGSKSLPNTPSSPPTSSPFTENVQVPIECKSRNNVSKSRSHGNISSSRECRSLQVDLASSDINRRHYSTSSSSSASSVYETNHPDDHRTKAVPLLSPLHEVSLNEDQRLHERNRRKPVGKTHLEVKTLLGCNNNQIQECGCSSGQSVPSINSLSSPDLGIGDSDDHHEGGNLKACLSLRDYQKLRSLINESICVMNTLEGVQKDFSLSILTRSEFVAESSPHLTSLSLLLSSAKTIFKSIYIHDNCGKPLNNVEPRKQTSSTCTMAKSDQDTEKLLAQLETLKRKKTKMERAISKQLEKTDRLLKRAASINELTE